MPELTEQQERLAREWLEKLKPALGIEALDRNKNKGGATQDEDGRKTASRGGGGLADVSDDECELEGGADEGASSRGSSGRKKDDPAVRAGDAFIKGLYSEEAYRLMDVWTKGEDGDEKQKEELERVKTIVRKVRSDPPIAPDEPVPVVVRPYDVDPGDTTSDIHFVYKHALTTVHDVLRQMAKRFKLPAEALDLVLGGKRLADEKTLLECGICAGFIVYLRVDVARANKILTTSLDVVPGLRTPITRLVMKGNGQVVVE